MAVSNLSIGHLRSVCSRVCRFSAINSKIGLHLLARVTFAHEAIIWFWRSLSRLFQRRSAVVGKLHASKFRLPSCCPHVDSGRSGISHSTAKCLRQESNERVTSFTNWLGGLPLTTRTTFGAPTVAPGRQQGSLGCISSNSGFTRYSECLCGISVPFSFDGFGQPGR